MQLYIVSVFIRYKYVYTIWSWTIFLHSVQIWIRRFKKKWSEIIYRLKAVCIKQVWQIFDMKTLLHGMHANNMIWLFNYTICSYPWYSLFIECENNLTCFQNFNSWQCYTHFITWCSLFVTWCEKFISWIKSFFV